MSIELLKIPTQALSLMKQKEKILSLLQKSSQTTMLSMTALEPKSPISAKSKEK